MRVQGGVAFVCDGCERDSEEGRKGGREEGRKGGSMRERENERKAGGRTECERESRAGIHVCMCLCVALCM